MNTITERFWDGRRVLLTGHTGFKGSWLSIWLSALGARVLGLSLAPETPSLFQAANVANLVDSREVDITDEASLRREITGFQPEVVLHLAAQSLVRQSYTEPVDTYRTNVMGTVYLLDALRDIDSVCSIVVVTSDKCYDNLERPQAYVESDAMGGYDPYSSSKACTELVTAAYRRSFFDQENSCGLASARAGNVIGGGDWAADRLVPDLLQAWESGEQLLLRNPDAVRPWQHVLEPLSGYLCLAECLATRPAEYCEGWNFGPSEMDSVSVAQVADRLCEILGSDAGWVKDPASQPHEAQLLRLDCRKAAEKMQWRPRWNLEQALQNIADWHRAYLDGADVAALCRAQISHYLAEPV